ncbi:MAG: hypothetical protein JNJ83_21575 [Verrucomicrobiaceae bacterium]|nr:hypothetical protein [Verrucomicrobiaceae bacterium]
MHGGKAESSWWPALLIGAVVLVFCTWNSHRSQSAWQNEVRQLQASLAALRKDVSAANQLALTANEALHEKSQNLAQGIQEIKTEAQKLQTTLATVQKAALRPEGLQPLQAQIQRLETQATDLSVRLSQQEKAPAGSPSAPTPAPERMLNAEDELVLLKERNRLTLKADEAMSTSKAEPLRALWAALRDPNLPGLKHAAAAEIIRVQNHLNHLTRIPPDFKLAADDAKLSTDELIQTLADASKPFIHRARAAMLLEGRNDLRVGDALVNAIRSDSELDVVKEAQHAMHRTFKFTVPLFDALSVETWWAQNKEAIQKQPSPAKQ